MSLNPRLKLAAVAVLAALPTLAAAHNYNFVEGGYVSLDDDADGNESGFRIAGSGDVHPNLALIGEYGNVDDIDVISAGALFHTPINPEFDWTAGATYERVDAGDEEDGYGLRTGLRWQTADARFELNPEVRYVDVVDDGTSVRLGALYALNQNLDLQAAIQEGDDDRLEAGVRYNFGPRKTGG